MSSKFHTFLTLPLGKDILILFEYEGRWAPELVWTLRGRKKSHVCTRNWMLDLSAHSLVTLPSVLSHLLVRLVQKLVSFKRHVKETDGSIWLCEKWDVYSHHVTFVLCTLHGFEEHSFITNSLPASCNHSPICMCLCLVCIISGYISELTCAWQYFIYIISSITFSPCYFVYFYKA